MNDSIYSWSAMRIVAAIAAREVTVEAVTAALADRVDSLDRDIHAFAWFDREALLRTARAMDRAAVGGVLHGLPVAIKDNIDTAGIPTAYGSAAYHGYKPIADAGCVGILRAAGGLVFGKTVTTELGGVAPARTRNPNHPMHTPGGSSSGSAAAVAAALVPVALGTQTAGAVICPAAYCGVVGFKPSPRRITRSGVRINSDTLDEIGVFGRAVDDVGWVSGVLALNRPNVKPSAKAFAPSIGIAISSAMDLSTSDMRDALAGAVKQLANRGAAIGEVTWPAIFDELFDAHATIQRYETARALGTETRWAKPGDPQSELSPGLMAAMTDGRSIDAAAYATAIQTGRTCAAALESLFAQRDVILTPATPGAAPSLDVTRLESTGDPAFCRPWQLLGCPMITLPGGLSEETLPLGLQLVARPGDDLKLLAAAAWVERFL